MIQTAKVLLRHFCYLLKGCHLEVWQYTLRLRLSVKISLVLAQTIGYIRKASRWHSFLIKPLKCNFVFGFALLCGACKWESERLTSVIVYHTLPYGFETGPHH